MKKEKIKTLEDLYQSEYFQAYQESWINSRAYCDPKKYEIIIDHIAAICYK